MCEYDGHVSNVSNGIVLKLEPLTFSAVFSSNNESNSLILHKNFSLANGITGISMSKLFVINNTNKNILRKSNFTDRLSNHLTDRITVLFEAEHSRSSMVSHQWIGYIPLLMSYHELRTGGTEEC